MSSIVIKGNTSGQVEIAAPAVAGSNTLTLPAKTGTVGLYAAPQVTVLTSGTGTYTTPTGASHLFVRMVGGGAGGQGVSAGVGYITGGTGGNTNFGPVYANGAAMTTPGSGGAGTATLRINGTRGGNQGSTTSLDVPGGVGAPTAFGGGGTGGNPASSGLNAPAKTGGGGGGAGGYTGWGSVTCAGGASGEYVEIMITSPSASYSYAVGAGGAGAAGASASGGAGGSGVIIVTAYFG